MPPAPARTTPDLVEAIPLEASTPILAASGLQLVVQRFPGGLEIPEHAHPYAYGVLVLRGEYRGHYGGALQVGRASAAAFRLPGEEHSLTAGATGVELFTVILSGCWLDRWREVAGDRKPVGLDGGTLSWLLTRVYREARRPQPHADSEPVLEGLLLEMLAACAPVARDLGSSRPPRWLMSARTLAEEHLEERCSLAEVARAVGVHPVHLAASFRRHYGCSLGEHVRRTRVVRACQALTAGDASLTDIAFELGFSD